MPTLGELVEQVRGHLNQYTVNRPATATFEDWVLDGGGNRVGLRLADLSTGERLHNIVVELATGELVHVTSFDANSGVAVCPPWFRAQFGTVLNNSVATNSRVLIEPLWPTYRIAQAVCTGIYALYPDLFAVKEHVPLSSSATASFYELANDVEGILSVHVEWFGPAKEQVPVWNWRLDVSNPDGKRYLRANPTGVSGRPIHVTYRAKPVVPSASSLSTDWATTGLPASTSDLPVLHAVAELLPAVEAAKTQMHSMEQSDRNRFVQSGSASAASRLFQDRFGQRLKTERRKLLDQFPPRLHGSR